MNAKSIGITVLLVVIVGALAGFGGYRAGVQAGTQNAQNLRAQFLADRGLGGNGGNGQGFAAGAGGTGGTGGNRQINPDNFANGQVKSVNGNLIEISTAQSVVKVQINDSTQIQKAATAAPADIQPGERITVRGTRGSDGTLTAQSIQIGNFGFGGPNAQGTPGAGRGQGGNQVRNGTQAGQSGQAAATPQP